MCELKNEDMDRKRLEKKILRILRTFVLPGMDYHPEMTTRINADMAFDSMDFFALTQTLEETFGFRVDELQWAALWADSELTVEQLCDFVLHQLSPGDNWAHTT